jgi:hypothetical protein
MLSAVETSQKKRFFTLFRMTKAIIMVFSHCEKCQSDLVEDKQPSNFITKETDYFASFRLRSMSTLVMTSNLTSHKSKHFESDLEKKCTFTKKPLRCILNGYFTVFF